jgi:hypothetical protein
MNALKSLTLAMAVVAAAAATAAAGPVGTAKARGDFRPFWQAQMSQYAPAHHMHHHRLVAHSSAPMHFAAPVHYAHVHHASHATLNHWALPKTDMNKITVN